MRRRGKNRLGTPTGRPQPQGIDSWSGFKVDLYSMKKQWDGNYTVDPDIRNPQDFVRGVKDTQTLPYARPESPDSFVAINIAWENGAIMTSETGDALLTEGVNPGETL